MTTPGIHAGIPEDVYHNDQTSLSHSGAKLLLPPSCPAKFRAAQDGPPVVKRVWDYGHVVHTLVLGEGLDLAVLDPAVHGLKKDGSVADSPRATATWKAAEQEARARGAVPVSRADFEQAQDMAAVVQTHPVASKLFADGMPELSLYAPDPVTGTTLRARIDWLTMLGGRVTMVDYKTCDDASPERFGRRAYDYGYHLQRAWYSYVGALCDVDPDADFVFVCQEKTWPYLVSVIRLEPAALALGIDQMRRAIDLYTDCTASNVWPGFEEVIHTASLPVWAYRYGEES